jgi:hypothetical protein
MLLNRRTLDGISAGTVRVVYRRWRRPAAVAGGRQRTVIGELTIDAVDAVSRSRLTKADAVEAGFASRAELLRDIDKLGDGTLYRISLHLAGPDPRIALRERDDLTPDEVDTLRRRLDRLDAASPRGPWTRAVLALIEAHPARRAPDLAVMLGRETVDFKRDVRKLKELGLTESLPVGYRLSPRGATLLGALGRYAPVDDLGRIQGVHRALRTPSGSGSTAVIRGWRSSS